MQEAELGDYHAVADVAEAVARHFERLAAREMMSVSVRLCLPADLASHDGIAICLWRVTPVSRNSAAPPSRNPSDRLFYAAAHFDLGFVAISGATDVRRQQEQLGWLLAVLSSDPVVIVPETAKNIEGADETADTVRLMLDPQEVTIDLHRRQLLQVSGPLIDFVASSATIGATPAKPTFPVIGRSR